MLIEVKSFEALDFAALMEVYIEGNQENADEFFPDEPPETKMELAHNAFRQYLRESFFQIPAACCWIWAEGDRYISALRLEPHGDGWLLEALETRPDCRRQGYARKLITAVLERLPAGTRVYSHVSKRNAASLAAHRSCGFVKLLDYVTEDDGSRSDHQVTFCMIK